MHRFSATGNETLRQKLSPKIGIKLRSQNATLEGADSTDPQG